MTIGELAQATGVSAALIRAWESRYGFPEPQRLASGHRRYSAADAAKIRRVIQRRDAGVRLEVAVAEANQAAEPVSASIHAELRRRHTQVSPQTLTKATLIGLSHAIEDEYCARADPALLIGAFQHWRHFQHSESRWRDMAQTANCTIVMAEEALRDPDLVTVPISAETPLRREWVVVVDSAQSSACLSAWEQPGQADIPDRARKFEALVSFDPAVVRDAARIAVHLASRSEVSVPAAIQTQVDQPARPTPPDLLATTALFTRTLGYLDRQA